jgi:hypothetical protein
MLASTGLARLERKNGLGNLAAADVDQLTAIVKNRQT